MKRLFFGLLAAAFGVSMTGCQVLQDMQNISALNKEIGPVANEALKILGDGSHYTFYLRKNSFTTSVPPHIVSEATTNLNYWVRTSGTSTLALRYALLSDAVQKKSLITPELIGNVKALVARHGDFFKGYGYAGMSYYEKWNAFIDANMEAVRTPAEFLMLHNFLLACLGRESESAFPRPWKGGIGYYLSMNTNGSNNDLIHDPKKYHELWQSMFAQYVKTEYQPKEFACIAKGDVAGFKASYQKHETYDVRYLEELKKAPPEAAKELAIYLYVAQQTDNSWVNMQNRLNSPSPAEIFIPSKNYDLCDALYASDGIRNKNLWKDPVVFAASIGDVEYLKRVGEKIDLKGTFVFGEGVPNLLPFEGWWRLDSGDRKINGEILDEKRAREQYGYTVLEIALLRGRVKAAAYLYDELGAPEPRINGNSFWMSLPAKYAPSVVGWLAKRKLLTAQGAYEKALEVKAAPFAKAIEEKYTNVKVSKKFDKYFAKNNGKPTPERAVELAKYLVSKGVATEDKAAGYSALAEIALNSLYQDTMNVPATLAVMKYLVENGADVTMRAQYYKETLPGNDAAKVTKITDVCVPHFADAALGMYQRDLGLDDAGMQELIAKVVAIPKSMDFQMKVADAQMAASFAAAFGGKSPSRLELEQDVCKAMSRPLIQEVLLKNGTINLKRTWDVDTDALGAAAFNKDLGLVKLIVEKGGKLPCFVTMNGADGKNPFDVSTKTSEEIANYLRAAERRQNR